MILSSSDEDSAKLSAPLPCVGQAGEVATGRGETCFPLPVPTSCEAWAKLAVHALNWLACGDVSQPDTPICTHSSAKEAVGVCEAGVNFGRNLERRSPPQ